MNSAQGYLSFAREATPGVAVIPNKTIPFQEGDFMRKQDVIVNSPIKANRWKALNALPGKIAAEGSHTFIFDPNYSVWLLSLALGLHTTTTVSSDTTAFKHTMSMATCELPTFTAEQMKGGACSGDTNKQGYQVDRAFGTYVDTLELSASDGEVELKVSTKALGIFQMARLTKDVTAGAAKTVYLKEVEGLAVGDSLNVYDETPQSETAAITAISLTNRTVTATLAQGHTVANKAKVELIPVAANFSTADTPFTFSMVRVQEGADITEALAATSFENYQEFGLTYNNNLDEIYGTLRSGPSKIAAKRAGAKVTYSRYYENNKKRDQYITQEPRAVVITLTNDGIISATDTNQSTYKMVIKLPKVVLTSYEIPTGNDDSYAEQIEAEVFYETVLGYAMQVEVTNAKNAAWYGL